MLNEVRVSGKPEAAVASVREEKRPATARALTPFDEMEHLMERMFEGWLPRGWLRPFHLERGALPELALEGWMPKVDVIDRDDDIVVRAEVAGVDKKDLDISVTESSVTLKGETKHEEHEEQGHYYRHEISRGAFARMVTLPAQVDTEKAKAEFKDGVVEVTMPKVAKSKRRSIKLE